MTIRPKLWPRTAAAVLAALSLLWMAPSAQAGSPTTRSDIVLLGSQCGFHVETYGTYQEAHYRHCTSGSDSVEITIYRGNGSTSTGCASPGDHILGLYGPFGVVYAEYNGRLC